MTVNTESETFTIGRSGGRSFSQQEICHRSGFEPAWHVLPTDYTEWWTLRSQVQCYQVCGSGSKLKSKVLAIALLTWDFPSPLSSNRQHCENDDCLEDNGRLFLYIFCILCFTSRSHRRTDHDQWGLKMRVSV